MILWCFYPTVGLYGKGHYGYAEELGELGNGAGRIGVTAVVTLAVAFHPAIFG